MIKVAEQVVIMAEVKKMNSRGFSKNRGTTDDGVNVETKMKREEKSELMYL
jgi:hypothetical protein